MSRNSFNRSRALLSAAAVLGTFGAASAARAAIVTTVVPSLAPNVFGSSYWAAYESNAQTAIENGQASLGTVGTPGRFVQLAENSALTPGDFTVTNFNSWRGDANPGASYGANYANEYGTRLNFGAHILGNGTKFSVAQISFNIFYNDAVFTNYPVYSVAPGSYVYDSGHVGVDYGGDGVKGGGDDTYITSGPNTQLVDEYITRGSGLGYEVLNTFPGASNQDKIDTYNNTSWGSDPFTMTGTYYLNANQIGASTQSFNVPEPTTVGVLGVAGVGLLARRRRR